MIGQQAHIPQFPEKCSYMIVRELPGPQADQAGTEAARAGNMTGLDAARYNDEASLEAAGANLVVTSLDEVAVDELAEGRLCRRLT
jgi:beta-phosphoglucomutase